MKSFRQIMLAICVILIASAFAGCGADTDSPDERPALDKIEYTNLNDSVSQKLLEDMLSGAGVSGNRIQGFFNRVDSFNESVREEWKSRGISFRENERIRLITVFFHDKPTEEESILFVGHVGVLLTADDGTLYFVEKVAFQEPYRLLRFADRTELSDYLMGKYDVSWGQSTARPFIMENDELMEGWRPNPDSADAAYH